MVDYGPGRNNLWHRNRRRFHRGGLARISSAFACRHRSETRSTAWNQDISGMVHIHRKVRGSIALANCWVVNDLVSCFRPHWLCIACLRRLLRHAAGLPATRGGIATWIGKPTSTPREPEPIVNCLAVIPGIPPAAAQTRQQIHNMPESIPPPAKAPATPTARLRVRETVAPNLSSPNPRPMPARCNNVVAMIYPAEKGRNDVNPSNSC